MAFRPVCQKVDDNRLSVSTMSDTSDENKGLGDIRALRDKVTVVVPTLNESEAIGGLLEEIKGCGYRNVLVVDGYSTDGTQSIARNLGAQVIGQHGKGKAGGVLTARDVIKTPFFVLMDGDSSYDPHDIDRFLPFMDKYDHIVGCRSLTSPNISRSHKIGNRILTGTFNAFMGSNIPDVCSGMYMLRTDRVKELLLDKPGYVVDQEIAVQTLIDGKVTCVPINYRKRMGKAKAPTWRQGFRALYTILQLAREYNPVFLGGVFASLAIIPGIAILLWFFYAFLATGAVHSTYLLLSVLLFVLGALGVTVSTIAIMLRRMERKITGMLRKNYQ